MAVAILAILAACLFGGFQIVIKQTASQQRDGKAETVLRSFAEHVQDPATPYQSRAGATCGLGRTYTASSLPSGYTAVVSDVQLWSPTAIDYGIGAQRAPRSTRPS